MSTSNSSAFGKSLRDVCDLHSLGVISPVPRDTVSSVGIIPRRLPFTKANNKIRYFRHALSLDEHRAYVLRNPVDRRASNLILIDRIGGSCQTSTIAPQLRRLL